jgi:putative FmdB family regulatory protein
MPTYQYRCTECGSDLEVVQKFSDAPLRECPTCAGSLRKVFNAVGVVFKGSGFYRTDSRVGAGQNGSAKGEGSAASGDKSAEKASSDSSGSDKSGSDKPGSDKSGSDGGGKGSGDRAGSPAKQPAVAASTGS